jgi:hypothetical protein
MTLREQERRTRQRQDDADSIASDLLSGCEAIAREIGWKKDQVYYGHAQGHFGGAVWKFGPRKLQGSKRKLRELFSGERA